MHPYPYFILVPPQKGLQKILQLLKLKSNLYVFRQQI